MFLLLSYGMLSNAFQASFGSRRSLSRGISMMEPLERVTGKSSMDVGILNRYLSLDQHDKIQAEYVWIDAVGKTRCKTRTLEKSRVANMDVVSSFFLNLSLKCSALTFCISCRPLNIK